MNQDKGQGTRVLIRWLLLALYSAALTAGLHFHQQGDFGISILLLFVIGFFGAMLVTYGVSRL
jgi:hypothetical protein